MGVRGGSRIPRGQRDRDRQPFHPCRKFRTDGWGNDPGAARRSAARHPACREAGSKGASQNGEVGPLPATAAIVRDASGGDRSPDRAARGGLRHTRHPASGEGVQGMMGIVEEGEEVMAEGKKKDETAADLALIGAAQKVEHYEMSGYITARNLAPHGADRTAVAALPGRRGERNFSTSSPGP